MAHYDDKFLFKKVNGNAKEDKKEYILYCKCLLTNGSYAFEWQKAVYNSNNEKFYLSNSSEMERFLNIDIVYVFEFPEL